MLGIGYNTELVAKKKVPPPACWKDLAKPIYAGDVQMANPNASGTAYTAIATLVQVFGEEDAFKLLKDMHKNISSYSRQGVGPIKATARGENMVAVAFIHDVVTEAQGGFPVKSVAPCEGTGYEIGSMSIVKGARNLENAQQVLRLGADARCAGARRAGQVVPAAVERELAGLAAFAQAERDQVDRLQLRQVRSVRRAQAPARALGARSRQHAQMSRVAFGPRSPRLLRSLTLAAGGIVALLLSLSAAAAGHAGDVLQLAQYRMVPGHGESASKRPPGSRYRSRKRRPARLFAQIKAERANPKGDIWWAGPGDAFLQAAEEGLLDTYRSPNLGQLHDWARREAELSQYRVAGVYGGILALGYNTEVFARKKLPVPKCWKDLTDPVYKGEVMLSNPNSSGTSYMMLATLVQIFGEDEAFRYMKALNANVNQYARSGIGPMAAVIRGESGIGSTVLHGVINEIMRGFPVQPILPCEGVGYEVGSMAIIKGARNLENARKFFDWALTRKRSRSASTSRSMRYPPTARFRCRRKCRVLPTSS